MDVPDSRSGDGQGGELLPSNMATSLFGIFAEIQEQTTQPEKSGGLTEGGPDHIDQNQGQQPGMLAKEFSAEMIEYCACHPECVPTEDLVLLLLSDEKQRLTSQKVITDKLWLIGNLKIYFCAQLLQHSSASYRRNFLLASPSIS